MEGWAYTTPDESFVQKLKQVTTDVHWSKENGTQEVIETFSHDSSFHPKCAPDVVAFPKTPAEAAQIMKLCHSHNVAVTPRGAGTGLEGGSIPYSGGVVICTSKLLEMRIEPENMIAHVGAGVLKNDFNKFLSKYGFLFGPDPSSNPSLGGMASTSGSGLSTLRYGTTRENIVSLLIVTPEGTLIKTRPHVRKASTGYEITQLYVGSEGTLGLIVELTVRINPILPLRSGAIVCFPDVFKATSAVVKAVQTRLPTLVRCELMNSEMIVATNAIYKTSLKAVPTLFLEFQSTETSHIESDSEAFKQIAMKNEGYEWNFTSKASEFEEVWSARRGCYWAAVKYRGAKDVVYISDVCVPLSALAQCVSETEADFKASNFPCFICAHIADGNFHVLIPHQPSEKERLAVVEQRLVRRAIQYGGAVSGEHGIGRGKKKYVIEEHGHDHVEVQKSIKRALDPKNILNPQNMLTIAKL